MSELITHTARLVPYSRRPKQVPSFVTAYSYEPLPGDPGSELGSLYVVMEVLISGRASEEVADLIIESIGHHYYNQAGDQTEPLPRFEAAIKAANLALAEHVNHGNAAWLGKLSAVAAIQAGAELHVASTGSAEAFLYRGKISTQITTNDTRPATATKTFGSIASGQLEAGDRLLLATPALIHQIQLDRLAELISAAEPNLAIAELTEILRGGSIERIAALVIEVTTPELAALRARTDAPSEIELGTPENAVEAVKLAAAPLAQTTLKSGKKFAQTTQSILEKAKPHALRLVKAVAIKSHTFLSGGPGRKRLAIALAAIILGGIALTYHQIRTAQAKDAFQTYQSSYQDFNKADQLLSDGHKSDAHEILQAVKRSLANLKPKQNLINTQLKTATLPEGEPRKFNEFEKLVAERLDQIDGLAKVTPATVVNFTTKNAKPQHFEIAAGIAYVFDDGNSNALSIVNLATNAVKSSTANFAPLGAIKSTAVASTGDGIYILTTKPSVWFYRFDTDSVTEQSISFGQWPKASGIGSYLSNLYLLSDTAVYKHLKNSGGFSPKSDYIAIASEQSRDVSALTVDGSVYLLSRSGLHRYIAGELKQSAPMPASLVGATSLHSTASGGLLVAANTQTQRIGLWQATDTSLTFQKQIALSNIKALYGATYVAKTDTGYALVDGRLVSFPIP